MDSVPTASRKTTLLADVGLFYAAAIWGSTFFVVKGALSGIDPVVMVAYRFLLAGTVLLCGLLILKRPVWRHFKESFFISIILWLLYVSQTVGLKFTTASNSGFITGLFVLFVPIFLRTIFRRRPTRMEWVASGVALIGLWILTGGLRQANFGDFITLVSAFTYALHVLYSDKYMKMQIDPFIISYQQFLLVGIFSLIYAVIFRLPLGVSSAGSMQAVVFLALFPSLSAFVIQMLAQKITAPIKVTLIFALEPVFAAIFAWTVGGEIMTTRGIFGGSLIFAAIILSGIPTRNKRAK